jgi:magnesium transporter
MQPDDTSVYYLFVTDYEEHLVGVVSLWQLVSAPPGARLFELMDRRQVTLPHDASLEEQAHIMSETGLQALPVVDEDGRLVGALDMNDLLNAMKDEATERLYHLAGVGKHETIDRSLFDSVRDRLLWLACGFIGIFLAVWMVSLFESSIAQVVVLALFIPIILDQGRSAGMQTLTLVVRSLALGKVTFDNARHVLRRELVGSTLTGLGLGVLVGAAGYLWQGSAALGLIAAVVTVLNLLVAAVVGVLIPLALKRLQLNPACGSAVLVTTATGLCGLFFFFGLSTLALQMGYL